MRTIKQRMIEIKSTKLLEHFMKIVLNRMLVVCTKCIYPTSGPLDTVPNVPESTVSKIASKH